MAPTTRAAILTACMSVVPLGGGIAAVRMAWAIPEPAVAPSRTQPGRVVEILSRICGTGNRRHTCYRPVVEYTDAGAAKQVATRGAYTPSPYARGAAAAVRIFADGTAWVDSEWQEREAVRRRDQASRRRFPLWMGWLLIGCGGFGLLLAAGLAFRVDTSGTEPAATTPGVPHA